MPTKENKPSLLVAKDEGVAKDRLYIGRSKKDIDAGESLSADNIDVVYSDDASLASRYFGWGIIRAIANAGRQAVLMTSKDKEIVMPYNQEDEE